MQRCLTHPSGPGLAGAADGLNPGAALCASGFTPLAGEQGSRRPRRKLVALVTWTAGCMQGSVADTVTRCL